MNRQLQCISLCTALMLAALNLVHAEDAEPASLFDLSLANLMDIRIVSAVSGFEQSLEDAPASVTVIDAEEWQAMGATTLTEAIDRVPGLHVGVVQLGLMFEKPIMRGLSGSFGQQVLLMIDGIPFRSPREGGAPWSQHLPLNGFKRIEIIRGSGSAIYGADAVGGIINLVSYKHGEVPASIALQLGEHNRKSLEVGKSLERNGHKLNLSWSTQLSDTAPERIIQSDLQSINDFYGDTSVSLAPGPLDSSYEVHTLRAAWQKDRLSVSYLDWHASDYGSAVGLSQALDPNGHINIRAQMLDANFNLSEHVTGSMNVKFAWQKYHLRTAVTLFPAESVVFLDSAGNIQFPGADGVRPITFVDGVKGTPGSDNRVISLRLNHIFEPSENHKVRWEIGLEDSDNKAVEEKNFGPGVYDGESTVVDGTLTSVTNTDYVYLPHADRKSYFIAAQDKWSFAKKWEATLGVRYDHYSDFGSTTNPRLGVVWHTNEKVSFKAYIGTAFRAPSFVDLYLQNNPAGAGNSDLKPEQTDMIDLGFVANNILIDELQYEASFFQYYADDLITYVPQINAQVAENSGRLKVRGVEQQINWRPSGNFSVEFNVSLVDPYESTDVDMAAVPQRLANLNLHYRHSALHWFVGGKWVAKRERDSGDSRHSIADYFEVDSKIKYSLGKWSMSLIVENLFDQESKEPGPVSIAEDFPLQGRRASFQILRNF